MKSIDWLSGVPIVLASARLGSATAAARELKTSTATVVRRLGAIEDALGARLFDRTPSGLLPTAALELVLPWAEQIEAAAINLEREVSGLEQRPVGVVRVALLPTLATRFVAPGLTRLKEQYPDLVVDLFPQAAVVDLVRREADIAVRMERPTMGDLVSKRLTTFQLAVAVSPELQRTTEAETLADYPWLSWSTHLANLPEARLLDAMVPNPNIVLRSLDLETLIAAAKEGLGALIVAEAVAAASGGLVHAPVPTPKMPEGELWLTAHRALRPVPRVAVTWDWLLEMFTGAGGTVTTTMPRISPSARRQLEHDRVQRSPD